MLGRADGNDLATRSGVRAGLLAFAALALPPAASAQVPSRPPPVRPWAAGPVLLYPLFSLDVQHTDNLFATSVDPIDTALASASVGLLAELPFRRSEGRAGYVLRFQEFDKIDLDRPVSQFFDLDTTLGFSNGGFLAVQAELQDGAYDTRVFDPGGEVDFQAQSFTNWNVGVEAGHESPTTRLIAIGVEYGDLTFDRAELGTGSFYDTESKLARLRGEHRRGVRSRLLWSLEVERNDLARPGVEFDNIRRNDSWTASLGYRIGQDRRSLFEVVAGWTDGSYERPESETAYDGIVGTFRWRRAAEGRARLEIRGGRYVLPSAYLGDDFYVSNQVRAQLDNAIEAKVALGAAIGLFLNEYPTGTSDREDRLVEGRAWIGYRFVSGIEWRVEVTHRDRSSSVDSLNYDELRVGTTLRLGI